jgi:hypothetical protein
MAHDMDLSRHLLSMRHRCLIHLEVLAMNLTSFRMAAAALVLSAAGLPAAQAVTLDSIVANGNTVSTDFFSPELISADIGFNTDAAVTLNMSVDGSEVLSQVGLNAVLDQPQPGAAFDQVLLKLSGGATFTFVGDMATLNALGAPSVSLFNGSQTALISLSVPESAVYVGNPFASLAQDWRIGVHGLSAGQHISLSVSAVPEASSLTLALAGLGMLGLMGRKTRRNPRA